MEQKIFMTDEARIKRIKLDPEFPPFWWLRSALDYSCSDVGYVHNNGYVNHHYAGYKLSVMTACMI